jgi:hypothetical protein
VTVSGTPTAQSSRISVRIDPSISRLFWLAIGAGAAPALLVGCGGNGPTIPRSALPRLVLQAGDLGPGFVLYDGGR